MTNQQLPTKHHWWTPPKNRTAYVMHVDGRKIYSALQIPSTFVICDLCNRPIAIRPVSLLYGDYAACPTCVQSQMGISVKDAAQKDGIDLTTLSEDVVVAIKEGIR